MRIYIEVPNVVNEVVKLVAMAAQHCADEANKEKLWE